VLTLAYSDLYNPAALGSNHNLESLPAGNLTVDPLFVAYDVEGIPSDYHLTGASPLVNAGDPARLDPDGSRSDMGAYGGSDAGGWDLDRDGYPDWCWPGTHAQAPTGFDAAEFDADDLDSSIH